MEKRPENEFFLSADQSITVSSNKAKRCYALCFGYKRSSLALSKFKYLNENIFRSDFKINYISDLQKSSVHLITKSLIHFVCSSKSIAAVCMDEVRDKLPVQFQSDYAENR